MCSCVNNPAIVRLSFLHAEFENEDVQLIDIISDAIIDHQKIVNYSPISET